MAWLPFGSPEHENGLLIPGLEVVMTNGGAAVILFVVVIGFLVVVVVVVIVMVTGLFVVVDNGGGGLGLNPRADVSAKLHPITFCGLSHLPVEGL